MRGLGADEHHFAKLFNATCRSPTPTLTLPLSLEKGEATHARRIRSSILMSELIENIIIQKVMSLLAFVRPLARRRKIF